MAKNSILNIFPAIFWLYAALVGALVVRIYVEETHYISPDSQFYLKVSQNILTGKGAVIPTELNNSTITQEVYFAVWPLGYPILIVLFSLNGFISVFWASKLVNFATLGLSFLFLHRLDKNNAAFLGLIFCAYPLVEVYSYTWSEGTFLTLLIIFAYLTYLIYTQQADNQIFIYLFLILSALFWVRYAGLIFYVFSAFLIVFLGRPNLRKVPIRLILSLGLASFFAGLYLLHNVWQTGYATGGVRVVLGLESNSEFWSYFGRSIFNSFFIIYHLHSNASFNLTLMFGILALVQIGLLFPLFKNIKLIIKALKSGRNLSFGAWLIGLAIYYEIMILILRFWMPFDKFDYRVMSPSLMLGLLGMMWLVKDATELPPIIKRNLIGLFLLSLLFNLPKLYFLNLLF